MMTLSKQLAQKLERSAAPTPNFNDVDPSDIFLGTALAGDDMVSKLNEIESTPSPYMDTVLDDIEADVLDSFTVDAEPMTSLKPSISRPNIQREREDSNTGLFHKQKSCKICGKMFNQPGNLSRHYAVHSQTRPYQCNICGKVILGSNLHHFRADHYLMGKLVTVFHFLIVCLPMVLFPGIHPKKPRKDSSDSAHGREAVSVPLML